MNGKNKERCLVTGGAGFIGSHITEKLLRSGHQVTVLDDMSSGRPENLRAVLDADPDGNGYAEQFRFVEGSIVDAGAVGEAIEGVATVFHQAAIPSVPRSFADPTATLRANVEGTAVVLEACREHEVKRVSFASSSSVYGDTPTLPKTEDMTPNPMSPYALSKLAGEHLCDVYARAYGIRTVALRYFNVFGPRQDPTSQYAAVVPNFVTRMRDGEPAVIYGDGKQSRDFTYIDNVVTANLLAAGVACGDETSEAGLAFHREPVEGALVVNIGAGARHTLLDLVDALNEIIGEQLQPELTEPRPGDVRHSHACVERARNFLGYEPTVSFAEGLRLTAASFGVELCSAGVAGRA